MPVFKKIIFLSMILLTSHAFASNITSWKSHYSTGADVWIEVEGKPGNFEDWVGIYPVGSSNNWDNVVDWRWARNTSVTEVDPGDWYKFNLDDGKYDARFFLNNSYTVEDSITFIVGVNSPEIYGEVGPYINEVEVNTDNPKYVVYKPVNHVDNAPIGLRI